MVTLSSGHPLVFQDNFNMCFLCSLVMFPDNSPEQEYPVPIPSPAGSFSLLLQPWGTSCAVGLVARLTLASLLFLMV